MLGLLLCLNIFLLGGADMISVPEEVMSFIVGCDGRAAGPQIPISRTSIDPASGTEVQEISMMDMNQLKASLQETVDSEQVIGQILAQVEDSLAAREDQFQPRQQGCTNIKIDVPPQEVKGLSETLQAIVQQNNYQLLEQINTLFSFKLNSFHKEIESLLNATLDEIKSHKIKHEVVRTSTGAIESPSIITSPNMAQDQGSVAMGPPTLKQESSNPVTSEVVETFSDLKVTEKMVGQDLNSEDTATEEKNIVQSNVPDEVKEKSDLEVNSELKSDSKPESSPEPEPEPHNEPEPNKPKAKSDITNSNRRSDPEPEQEPEPEPEPEQESESEPEQDQEKEHTEQEPDSYRKIPRPSVSRPILRSRRPPPPISRTETDSASAEEPKSPVEELKPPVEELKTPVEEKTAPKEDKPEVEKTGRRGPINPRKRMQMLLAERRRRFKEG